MIKSKITKLTALAALAISPRVNAATPEDVICNQPGNANLDVCGNSNLFGADSVFQAIIQALIYIVGVASVIVIIIAGLMYVVSAGDANRTKQAKDAIIYAIVGVVIALLAQGILRFVTGAI